jgi:hypothetical protein
VNSKNLKLSAFIERVFRPRILSDWSTRNFFSAYRKETDHVLVTKWDRFSRNQTDALMFVALTQRWDSDEAGSQDVGQVLPLRDIKMEKTVQISHYWLLMNKRALRQILN